MSIVQESRQSALQCYREFDIIFQGQVSATNAGVTQSNISVSPIHFANTMESHALIATCTTVAYTAWYMDNGATDHVTMKLDNL